MNGPCCHQFLSTFDFGDENMFLDTNELTCMSRACGRLI